MKEFWNVIKVALAAVGAVVDHFIAVGVLDVPGDLVLIGDGGMVVADPDLHGSNTGSITCILRHIRRCTAGIHLYNADHGIRINES